MNFIDILLMSFVSILASGLALFFYFQLTKRLKNKQENEEINLIRQESREIRNEFVNIVRDVTEKLVRLDETNKRVVGFAEQLRSIENILTNPKQRGILGEYVLEQILQNVFAPDQYQMQYKFKDGEVVDAVIFTKEGLIPVDSKFSLENYNRLTEEKDPAVKAQMERAFKQDLKNRIEETSKYIRPEEGTLEFALMFIPAEGIYYDLLVNEVGAVKVNTRSLLEYAVREKSVHIVSPTTFYAFLQSILQGWRAFQIEKSAKDIIKRVEILGKHYIAFDEYMKKLGSHLDTACRSYNIAYKELGKIDKDVLRISGGAAGERKILPVQVDKTHID